MQGLKNGAEKKLNGFSRKGHKYLHFKLSKFVAGGLPRVLRYVGLIRHVNHVRLVRNARLAGLVSLLSLADQVSLAWFIRVVRFVGLISLVVVDPF